MTRVAPSSLASPADVLRGSSRIPFPLVSGAGTRYEPLRTSAGDVTSSCACLRVFLTVNSRHLKLHRSYSISLNLQNVGGFFCDRILKDSILISVLC